MAQKYKTRGPSGNGPPRERLIVTIKLRPRRSPPAAASPLPPSSPRRNKQTVKLTLNPGNGRSSNFTRGNSNSSVRVHIEPKQFSDEESDSDSTDDLIPYRGVITGEDASTVNTLPTPTNIKHFESCVKRALEKSNFRDPLQEPTPHVKAPTYGHTPGGAQALLSQIKRIRIGAYEIETWYTAPYPEEYSQQEVLFLCQYCLRYMSSEYIAERHLMKCKFRQPPGREIYKSTSGKLSVFEVDGAVSTQFCQNLCLLAKMFLNSKTLYYDVPAFRFYVLTENDKHGASRMVGYFSKEKKFDEVNPYNVSCILCMPTAQRKGYGNFLIDFSYFLSRTEGKAGTPEKPLSELGLLAYRNYWKLAVCYALRNASKNTGSGPQTLSIKSLSESTGMTPGDVTCALEQLEFLVCDHKTHRYGLRIDMKVVKEVIRKWESKGYESIEEKRLVWWPPFDDLPQASSISVIDSGQAIDISDENEPPENPSRASNYAMTPSGMDRSPTRVNEELVGVMVDGNVTTSNASLGIVPYNGGQNGHGNYTNGKLAASDSISNSDASSGSTPSTRSLAVASSSAAPSTEPAALISTTTITTTTTTTTTTLHTSMSNLPTRPTRGENKNLMKTKVRQQAARGGSEGSIILPAPFTNLRTGRLARSRNSARIQE